MIQQFDITKTYTHGDQCLFGGEKYTFSKTEEIEFICGVSPDEYSQWKKGFSRQDMIDFATKIYNDIADLPGHEPTEKDLDDWVNNNMVQQPNKDKTTIPHKGTLGLSEIQLAEAMVEFMELFREMVNEAKMFSGDRRSSIGYLIEYIETKKNVAINRLKANKELTDNENK